MLDALQRAFGKGGHRTGTNGVSTNGVSADFKVF